ncbi:hypothetical protein NM688_g4093 [Phlebia brevispora]|uniref:Uncharacterized protein n=1 Tax=Phlebia brevispora TaxID=194682 RepID=A0ACC1T4A7_9APHY|nr:hypothetical protein NM688_g4093 [Phlebia brevispora]
MRVKATPRHREPPLFDIWALEPEDSSDESDKENNSEDEREDDTRDDAGRHPTPVRMQAPSDHDRESIHPYVREDLKGAKAVGFFSWTEAVLGISSTKLLARAREIAKLRWFEDKIIQEALIDYCRGTTEKARYNPFVHLSNRVVELARGKLAGVSKYPVNDFCIANNSDRVVQTIPEHGALGAKRRPDLLGLSQSTAVKLYSPRGSVHWFDILFWGELKQINVLVEPLSKERKARYMSSLDDSGFPTDRPKSARARPRLPPVEPDVQTDQWFKAWGKILLETTNMVQTGIFDDSDTDDNEERDTKAMWETAGGVFTKHRLKAVLSKAFPISRDRVTDSGDSDSDGEEVSVPDVDLLPSPVNKFAPPKRQTRARKAKPVQPVAPPENDIRSRLRPRPPRA